MKLNYGEWVWAFRLWSPAGAINVLGNHGTPKLRDWLTMDLSFALFDLGFGLALRRGKWRRPQWKLR